MAGERTLPGLGLKGFWTPGSNGWDADMDGNLRMLSALSQLIVLARQALPGSPTNGQVYIITTAGADLNKIAIRDNGAWVLFTPVTGWIAYVVGESKFVYFTGTAWVDLVPPAVQAGMLPLANVASLGMASPTYDINFTAFRALGFRKFEMLLRIYWTATTGNLRLRVSNDNGASFLTTNYRNARIWGFQNGASNGSGYDGSITTGVDLEGTNAGRNMTVKLAFTLETSGAFFAAEMSTWDAAIGGEESRGDCVARHFTSSVDALRFYLSDAGNITDIIYKLYGFKE